MQDKQSHLIARSISKAITQGLGRLRESKGNKISTSCFAFD